VRYVCAPLPTLQATGEVYVPISPEGEEIKTYVRQPRAMRPPVGCKLAFLEQYHPNHTAYLPPNLRDQLHAMGRARAEQTSAGMNYRHDSAAPAISRPKVLPPLSTRQVPRCEHIAHAV